MRFLLRVFCMYQTSMVPRPCVLGTYFLEFPRAFCPLLSILYVQFHSVYSRYLLKLNSASLPCTYNFISHIICIHIAPYAQYTYNSFCKFSVFIKFHYAYSAKTHKMRPNILSKIIFFHSL